MTLKHNHQTAIADDPSYDVGADEWNADHIVSGTSLQVQYNNGGSLSGMAGSSWDNTNGILEISGQGTAAFNCNAYGTNTSPGELILSKTRGASPTTQGAVVAGDFVGKISAQASDGNNYLESATWKFQVENTRATAVSGRQIFQCQSTDAVLYDRLSIENVPRIANGHLAHKTIFDLWPVLEISYATDPAHVLAAFHYFGADTEPAYVAFAKSRGTTVGEAGTIVQNGDGLGSLYFAGDDGTDWITAVVIDVVVDGSPSAGAIPGKLSISTSQAGNITEVATFDAKGNAVIGTAAISTSATDKFLYIPTCAGTPTGTPTTYTGRAPIVYDTTNNKLYVYNGAWKGVTLA